MFRYIAFLWNPASTSQAATAARLEGELAREHRDWQVGFEREGARIYCAGARRGSTEVHALADRAGVVLGTVFERAADGGETRKARFDRVRTGGLVASRGRDLIDRYWGRYVAFIFDAGDGAARVIRAPNGEIDCLTTTVDGVRLVFSDASHCPPLDTSSPQINWDYIAAELATLIPERRETGLLGVERILRGECLCIQADAASRQSYWDPLRFAKDPDIDDPHVAAQALRDTTRSCLNAWASCYDGILAMLSGGLDSSIIVGLLRHSPTQPKVVCVNYRNAYDSVSDERRYARLVAQRAGYPLIEREQDAHFSLDSIMQLPRYVSPWLSFYEMGETATRGDLARTHGAGAYFTGQGGDEVFFKTAASYMCADFIHQHGARPAILPIALTAARLYRGTIWSALREGLRDGLRKDPLAPALKLFEFSPLLRPEIVERVRAQRMFIPPWLDGASNLAPGKCWQVISLSGPECLHTLYGTEDDPEIVSPLLAQPVKELCLRIQTQVTTHGGRSRGLAREAFHEYLPREVVRRQSKGALLEFIKVIWQTNMPFVKSLLLDGILVNEGLVDRNKLERTLANDFSKGLGETVHVSSLICAEAWARAWTREARRIAA